MSYDDDFGDGHLEQEEFSGAGPLTTRELVEVQNNVFSDLLGHGDPPVGENGRPYFRPSSLAFCPRVQLLWRAGVEPTRTQSDEDRADMQRRFARGNRIEREVLEAYELAGLLIQRQVSLTDEDLQVHGNADALWGGEFQRVLPSRSRFWSADYAWAVRSYQEAAEYRAAELKGTRNVYSVPITLSEVKSSHSFAVNKMRREGAAPWHRAQLGCYALIARRHPEQLLAPEVERFEFAIFAPDGSKPLTIGLQEADVEAAEERLGMLVEAWHTGDWPECECGTVPGMAWAGPGRCDYTDPGDHSSCCGKTLLDRLEASVAATAKAGS